MTKIDKIKNSIHEGIDYLRAKCREYFVADGTDNVEVRTKHKRVGFVMSFGVLFLLLFCVYISYIIDNGISFSSPKKQNKKPVDVHINKLAGGVEYEKTWAENATQAVMDLKMQQEINEGRQLKLEEDAKGYVTKKEMAEILKEARREMTEEFEKKLSEQKSANVVEENRESAPQMSPIETISNKSKIVVKKIGTYIPAGSYVEAKMISGVDAGIGITAEADPRQVLLRITGKVISAGFGKDYLTTDKLKGCVVQCQATGDLSSEKAYLKPVVMTCAKDFESVVEVPVKGYVSANGKVGIRGEIVSREGDLVAKSFLSGLVGGFGNGVSQFYEPQQAISAGFAIKTGKESAKSILGAGLGQGVSDSSSRLSDYLIKRAEQYQPVISINEGVSVDLVFQEGFSLNEEDGK